MEYNNIFFSNILEEKIFNILNRNINNNSKIEINKRFTFNGGFYVADFFLSEGCDVLNIKPNTAIEVINRLLFDSIDRVFYRAKRARKIENLIIVYNSKLPGVETNIDTKYDDLDVIVENFSIFEKRESPIDSISLRYIDTSNIAEINIEKDKSKTKLKDAFNRFRTTLILGAGVSISAGATNWYDMLKNLIKAPAQYELDETYFDVTKKYCHDSSLILGRFLMEPWRIDVGNFNNNVLDIIRDCIYPPDSKKTSELIKEIADLVKRYQTDPIASVESIITYNYDDRIEQALSDIGINCYPVYGNNTPQPKSLPVYHVHGILPYDKSKSSVFPILSEESYHHLYKKTYNWSTIQTLHALMRNTCLLIGFSMSDPNLRRLLEFAASESDGEARHFVFLKREHFDDVNIQRNLERRQKRVMNQLGLNIIWFDNFKELPQIINKIQPQKSRINKCGIDFTILEQIKDSIRLKYSKKIEKDILKSVINELKTKYQIINFTTNEKELDYVRYIYGVIKEDKTISEFEKW